MASTKILSEENFRKQSEAPEIAHLDQWHALCREKLGGEIEVIVMNRRDHPATREFTGWLNTAIPLRDEERGPILALLLEISDEGTFEELIWTHELGHWILKLQGFQAIQQRSDPHTNTEILINSLAQHPALYALQRSHGLDPQNEIDSRARHDLSLMGTEKPRKRLHQIETALLFADDILNCSSEIADELRQQIRKYHKKTSQIVDKILDTAAQYDLHKQDSNKKFIRRVVQALKLGSGWVFLDEVSTTLRGLVEGS